METSSYPWKVFVSSVVDYSIARDGEQLGLEHDREEGILGKDGPVWHMGDESSKAS